MYVSSGLCKLCVSETILELHRTTVSQNDADCDNLPTTTDGGIISFYEVDIPWKKFMAGVAVNDKAAARARVQELIGNRGTVHAERKDSKNP